MRFSSFCSTSAALLISANALAADDLALTEDDFFAPMPTVLTAARLAQPLSEAPVAMTVIDRDMIEASSAIDVVELLRLVPGFQVARKEGIDTVATYHGFADGFPRRKQVLVDGRSVYDPGLNGVVWSALPLTLNQIERIEVVRGSNAAAYGSNAVLGTINIITRNAAVSDRLNVKAMGGSDDSAAGEFSHAGAFEDGAYRIDARRWLDRGFDQLSDTSKSSIANFQGSYRPGLADELTLRAGYRETDFDSNAFRYPRERVFRSNFQQLTWNRSLDSDEDLQVQFYRNAFEAPDVVNLDDVPGNPLPISIPATVDYSLESERYDLEVLHRWSPSEPWRVSWGLGLRRDTVEGGVFDTADELTRDQYRAFGNSEWRAAERLVINAGLMAEHYDDLDTYYSPRLATNWLLGDGQTLRLGAARAYRIPTFLEQRGGVTLDTALPPPFDSEDVLIGSAGLDAERVDSVELGYLFELPNDTGSLDLRLFHYDIEPIIDDAEVEGPPDFRQFIEAGSLDLTGFEAQASFRPFRGNRINLAYAYVDAGGSRVEEIDPAGNPILASDNPESNGDKVPRHTLTAMVAQDLARDWTLSGTYYYVDEMTWMGEGETVGSIQRVDAKVTKRVPQPGGEWVLSLTAHNLLDDEHYEFAPPDLSVPLPGNRVDRRFFVQAEYRLR